MRRSIVDIVKRCRNVGNERPGRDRAAFRNRHIDGVRRDIYDRGADRGCIKFEPAASQHMFVGTLHQAIKFRIIQDNGNLAWAGRLPMQCHLGKRPIPDKSRGLARTGDGNRSANIRHEGARTEDVCSGTQRFRIDDQRRLVGHCHRGLQSGARYLDAQWKSAGASRAATVVTSGLCFRVDPAGDSGFGRSRGIKPCRGPCAAYNQQCST